MMLIDTSVWVSHLREGNKRLSELLSEGQVLCHPFIIGELACGNLKNRLKILSLLQSLPMVITASHEEVIQFIENYRLMGQGLGYIDVHLLASALLTDIHFWTLDRKLNGACAKLGLCFDQK